MKLEELSETEKKRRIHELSNAQKEEFNPFREANILKLKNSLKNGKK
jgi:hypothetical protein